MIFTRICRLDGKKYYIPLILTLWCWNIAGASVVSLDQTVAADESVQLENLTSIIGIDESTWAVLDRENGVLIRFSDGQSEVVQLSGKDKTFDSSKVSGLADFGDGKLLVSNSGDDNAVVIDAAGAKLAELVNEGRDQGSVREPSSVAWSANRRLYIADTGNDRISVFGTDGVFIQAIDRYGEGEGLGLRDPVQVAVDPQERIYVLEERDGGVISVFDSNGTGLVRFTSEQLKAITGDAIEVSAMNVDDDGLLYLADNSNGRVFQIDWQKKRSLNSFGSKGEQRGQFDDITALAVLADGRLAVGDSGNRKIEIYRLQEATSSGAEPVRLPTVGYERDIRLDCDRAYRIEGGNVICFTDDKVASYKSSGKLAVQFSGEFSRVSDVSVDDQNVAIVDDDALRIYRLDGAQRFEVGGSGKAPGKLDSPRGVSIRGDKIYVADTGNRRVQIFSSDGIFLSKISNPEGDETLFSKPVKVIADANDNLFVLDEGASQVLVFSSAHKLLYRIGTAAESATSPSGGIRFESIHDIAVDRDDNLYILAATASSKASIHVYSGPTRSIVFGAASEARSGMSEPVSLSIAPARKTVVSVYDEDKKTLLNYRYMQVPATVGGLKVAGDKQGARLSWQRAPGSYISRYKVYASREEDGSFQYITDVSGTEAEVEHEDGFANGYYGVSAVSGFSVEGAMSSPRADVFQEGYALYRQNRFEESVAVFSKVMEKDPGNASVIKYVGLASLELGNIDDAVAYFRELSRIEGHETEGLNLQIDALVRNRDYVAAKAAIDRVIADETASVDTLVNCGEISLALGDAIGAVGCLEQAMEKASDNSRAHILMGQAYLKLGINDKGLEEFAAAIAIAPQDPETHYRSGLALLETGDNEAAISAFDQAIEVDTDHGASRLELARLYLSLERFDEARTIAVKLAGDKGHEGEGQYMLGLIAYATEEYGRALLALNKATRADPGNADAWLTLADTYAKMNQSDKIRGILVKAVEGDDRSFAAATRLGNLDYDAGDYTEAANSLAIAVDLKPDDYSSQYRYADALYRTGAYKQAQVHAASAAELDAKSTEPLILIAEISNRQGKNGEAIDSIKRAMALDENSADLHTRLGALYVENSVFDLAKPMLEKAAILDPTSAASHYLMGQMFMQRRLFDDAIKSYDKAVSLDGSAENKLALDTAYAEKKKSMEFKSNAPSIVLKDLQLEKVFSAAYKQYSDRPIGSVTIENTSAQQYGNLKLTFSVKGYMDFPATTELPLLEANATQQVDLFAAFNNKVLEIDEDTGVQVEVAVKFIRDGRDDAISITQPMTIYGKNAIVWGESNMIGSFVTPKDDTLRDFVRQAINENRPEAKAVDKSLLTTMTLFNVFGTHGIKYVVDPNSPYSSLSDTTVDYVQFSRETLKIKSGDCDDLSVLLSASLENLGIETAVIDVPGHLLMMFSTGLQESERDAISLDDELLVIRDGKVWIPVEATMIGQNFAEAWAEGARKYRKFSDSGELSVVALRDAWQDFKPVTLKPANFSLKVPQSTHVAATVQREKNLLLEKSLDRLVRPYRALVEMNPANASAQMQIAIIYARYGLRDTAIREFDNILAQHPDNGAVYNNQGNIYFNEGDFDRALENYRYAEKLASNDSGIKMNLSMAYYRKGDLGRATEKYDEASMIDDGVDQQYAGYIKLLSN